MSVIEQAKRVGFTEEQAKWIESHFARKGHHHEIEEIDGLEEALAEGEEEDEEDEEE